MALEHPEYTGFNITGISGLGPPKATINSTVLSTSDGSLFNSSRVGERNIVIDIEFCDFPDIETARQRSYEFFPIKKPVTLIFETDNRFVETSGYVESNTPNIFSQRATTQISIICQNSYFYGVNDNETAFNSVTPTFQFEFGNESLTAPGIEFGTIVIRQAMSVVYDGEVDTGVVIDLYATGPVGDVTIQNQETGESMLIIASRIAELTGSGLVDGDYIRISTIKGSKYIVLVRNGGEVPILQCLDRYSSWFTLSNGDNVFSYSASSGVGNLQVSFYNKVVYEGI